MRGGDGGGAPWAAGDRAQCVDVRDIRLPLRHVATGGRLLTLGAIYPVRGVLADDLGVEMLDLGLKSGAKLAMRFVKVGEGEEERVLETAAPRELEGTA